jgi:hypothetical protein
MGNMLKITKVVCVLLVLLITTISYGKEIVKCKADLAEQLTKDGFARIILTCEKDVLINKFKPLKMYVNQGVVVFNQTNVDKSMLKPVTLTFPDEQPPEYIPAMINPRQHKILRLVQD